MEEAMRIKEAGDIKVYATKGGSRGSAKAD